MKMTSGVLLAIAICSAPMRVAAEATPESRAQAKQHYEAGEKAFRLGDLDRAIAEWKQSYELSSVALLL